MSLQLQKVFQEMLYILDWMDEIKVSQEMHAGNCKLQMADTMFDFTEAVRYCIN